MLGVNSTGESSNLRRLTWHFIDAFNFFLEDGTKRVCENLPKYKFTHDKGEVEYWISNIEFGEPPACPRECRETFTTYSIPVHATINWRINSGLRMKTRQFMGKFPIVVGSKKCKLYKATEAKLVEAKEEEKELGGYFIINGKERIIRMLIMPRRNYATAVSRDSNMKSETSFTELALTIRSVKSDESAVTNVIHYLRDGTMSFRFPYRKRVYLVPILIVLKALKQTSDREIMELLLRGEESVGFIAVRVEKMLKDFAQYNLFTKQETLQYLGSKYRVVLRLPDETAPDKDAGQYLLDNYVLIHAGSNEEKFDIMIHMMRKLFALANGAIDTDNTDSIIFQETLLGGYLLTSFVKEKLMELLDSIKVMLRRKMRTKDDGTQPVLSRVSDVKELGLTNLNVETDIGQRIEQFLATGNLISQSGLGLNQVNGLTIMADRINFLRYISHFRSIHRGSFFQGVRTTGVRKLLPESWGFLCPVHTPDGIPCGLLNHISSVCEIVTEVIDTGPIINKLYAYGMMDISTISSANIAVLLDGIIMGAVNVDRAEEFVEMIRDIKLEAAEQNSSIGFIEVAAILPSFHGLYPGIFIFTSRSRFRRPVINLRSQSIEFIGTFEQPFMSIACLAEDVNDSTTHREIKPTNILSLNASLVPFENFNQSPRNMYQCQMAKQTMGFPYHNLTGRVDSKMYVLQTPQRPIVSNEAEREFSLFDYPQGTNAIVAVISYTGYDMEDALVLNKSSVERGMANGIVYKQLVVTGEKYPGANIKYLIGNIDREGNKLVSELDDEGIIPIPSLLKRGDPYCVLYDEVHDRRIIHRYEDIEPCMVDEVRIVRGREGGISKAVFRLRFTRPPKVGDKFSSRHGQKGVVSVLWPQEDMPFTDTGMVPDIIINPHAFPSRMTIGMLVESLAGKAGALNGTFPDSTPFVYSEKFSAIDEFGEQLREKGFNYYGNEKLYSGIHGTQLKADVFIGVVYYQRLRHMVSDKYQVRSTGPINELTHQPIGGRKKGGGVRFGEMERDALIAHGTSFLLKDRLMNCSDSDVFPACRKCGSLISTVSLPGRRSEEIGALVCRNCGTGDDISHISMPYVFKYLAVELAAMNVKLRINVKERE